MSLTLIGLDFYMFRLGGGGGGSDSPSIIFVVCGPIAAKFCTRIDNQSRYLLRNLAKRQ